MGLLHGIGSKLIGWVGGIRIVAVICAFAALLGLTGVILRRGVELRKACRASKAVAAQQGYSLTDRWRQDSRKAARCIAGPIIGWALVYALLFHTMPLRSFELSLTGLIPVALGYFGVFLTPDVG